MALWLWSCDSHFLGCRCEAPPPNHRTGSFPFKTKTCRCGLWPGSGLSLRSRTVNDLKSRQAAGGPLELSHRPGNSALGGRPGQTGSSPSGLRACEGSFSATEMAKEMGIFWQNTQKVFPQLQLWFVVGHLISAHPNYPLTDVF